MAKKDLITREYTAQPAVFADIFNYYLFQGKQIIKAENLKSLCTGEA